MNYTDSREARKMFWKGFRSGFGESLRSPENLARTRTNVRFAYWASLIGSLAAYSWVKHLRAENAQPFGTSDQFAVVTTGAIGATVVVELGRWVWRRRAVAHRLDARRRPDPELRTTLSLTSTG